MAFQIHSGKIARGGVLRRRTLVFLLACVLGNAGCMTSQLRTRMTDQAASIPGIYYQIVLDNLAMIQADPARLPYFSDPQTARSQIEKTASVNYGMNLDLITAAPAGVLSLFDHYLLDKFTLNLTGGQNDTLGWLSLTANDPDKLFAMRAAYRRVLGAATIEDEEILSEFYYRHFEITDESLTNLQFHCPEVFDKIGARLAKLKGIEYLSVDSFEARLKQDDILGKDDLDRYRRILIKHSRMRKEVSEFLSDTDSHHLLYVTSLRPGWFGAGRKRDIPRHTEYVGRYGKTCVWVTPENTETLTRFTLAILDIHTYKSERFGGSRVLPGILSK
jgi:hypothetical protein